MLEVLYNTSVLDVEATLRRACWKVLHDRGVSKEAREERATALLHLGTVFLEHARSKEEGLTEFRAKMEMSMGFGTPPPAPYGGDGADTAGMGLQLPPEVEARITAEVERMSIK